MTSSLERIILSQYVVFRIDELTLPTLRLLLTECSVKDVERSDKLISAIALFEKRAALPPEDSPPFDWAYGGARPHPEDYLEPVNHELLTPEEEQPDGDETPSA
jgi:hypothetical protein